MVSCILLSAGLSTRFGSPKALATIRGVTVIERLQRILIESHVGEVIVVLGAEAEKIRPFLLNDKKLKPVYNADYRLGQTSSVKTGIKVILNESCGIMLWPIDYPLIRKETIDQLTLEFLTRRPSVLIPTYTNRKGHPPIFHVSLKTKLLTIDNHMGINSLQRQFSTLKELQPCSYLLSVDDPGILCTFNTPEEFTIIRNQIEKTTIDIPPNFTPKQ